MRRAPGPAPRPATTTPLRLDIGPVLEILHEMADGAGDFLVFVRGERDGGDEADGEPGPLTIIFCGC